jgi:tetratricopeptide (TPR) repeat protein
VREYDKAIEDFTEAIRLGLTDAYIKHAYYQRYRAWAFKGEYEKAIADCSEAIRIDPHYVDAYVARGLSWDELGKYDKAIADYNEALRIDPQSANAYHNRGLSWTKSGEYDKAIADYSETIRLDPQDPRAYNARGISWMRSGNFRNALADYREALRLDPKKAIRYGTLAWPLACCPDRQFRDGAEAVHLASKACELTEYADAQCLGCLAAAHAETGNFAEAVAWQRKALELAAADEKAAMQKALKLYEAGKPYRDDQYVTPNHEPARRASFSTLPRQQRGRFSRAERGFFWLWALIFVVAWLISHLGAE